MPGDLRIVASFEISRQANGPQVDVQVAQICSANYKDAPLEGKNMLRRTGQQDEL